MPRVTRSRVRPPAPPSAPLQAYTAGTQAGVPTGTSLTATSGLPTQDSTTTFVRTDPITGSTVSLSGVKKWFNRSWAATISQTTGSGEVWWFDRCAFRGTGFFSLDIETGAGANNRLSPTLILTNCSIGPGSAGTVDKAMAANRVWLEDCDINVQSSGQGTAEDGWIGAAYSTMIRGNTRCGVGNNATDPHSDGVQLTDTGEVAFYLAWLDGGSMTGATRGNAAIRVGTEFGATPNVWLRHCGIGGNSFNNVQFRGDNGTSPSPITGVRFRGNRWCSNGAGYVHDFQQESGGGTMISEWTDNAFGIDCTIDNDGFHAAGSVISSPGV